MESALSWSTRCVFTLLAHCNKWHRSWGNFPQRRCFSEGYACQLLPWLCFRPWGCRACRYPSNAVTPPLSPHPRHCARILWWHNPGPVFLRCQQDWRIQKGKWGQRHKPSGKRHEDLLTSYKITASKWMNDIFLFICLINNLLYIIYFIYFHLSRVSLKYPFLLTDTVELICSYNK